MTILETYLNNLSAALKAKNDAYTALKTFESTTYNPAENWFNQVNDGNHPAEWQGAKNALDAAAATRNQLSNDYTAKLNLYNQALKDYNDAKALATPEELNAINLQAQANANLAAAQAEAQKQTADTKTYKEKTTTYLIIAGGILLFIVIAAVAYKKLKGGALKA